MVDVHIVTFNHAQYIGKCLDSILSQETSFDVRIVVGDDCSNDGTQEILQDYQRRFPDKIELLLNDKNLGPDYLPGLFNFLNVMRSMNAKYVAMIEGDDYWTDSQKLEKQVGYLENNPSAAGCFHDTVQVDDGGAVLKELYYKAEQNVYTQEDCMLNLKSAYATSALLFRGECIKDLPAWYTKWTSDYALDLLITERGELHHIDGVMSAYRIHDGGIWMGKAHHENMKQLLYRYLHLLRYAKFKRLFGTFLKKEIKELNRSVTSNYMKHRALRSLLRHIRSYVKYRWF